MVANMQSPISTAKQQPEDSSASSGKGRGDQTPRQLYTPWFLQTDQKSSGKTDMQRPSIPLPDETSNSWEIRAFAEDASSLAAGIWPPRAYPCSFCRREFRSAQALGGHMNVHRRDRARLRQSSPPPSPFRTPTSLFHTQKYASSSPVQSAQNSLNMSPTVPVSISSILPTLAPCSSLITNSYSANFATSFPLRLHQLASEAASSFMQFSQPSSSGDLCSLWPTSIACTAKLAAQYAHAPPSKPQGSTVVFLPAPSSRLSSAGPSPCTTSDSTLAGLKDAPVIEPNDESRLTKRPNTTTSCALHRGHKLSRTSSQTEGTQLSVAKTDEEDIIAWVDQTRKACGDVDLELRLGQRPP